MVKTPMGMWGMNKLEYIEKWRKENPEKVKIYMERYRKNHPDRIRERYGSKPHGKKAVSHVKSWDSCVLLCRNCHFLVHCINISAESQIIKFLWLKQCLKQSLKSFCLAVGPLAVT